MYRVFLSMFVIAISCLSFSYRMNDAHAQTVMLPIENTPQETVVWCWAAVAQQIVHSLNLPVGTPPQCHMVATALNAPPNFCCNQFNRFNGNPTCRTTGSLKQIQWLIGYFGGQSSVLAPPAHPNVLFETLRQGRAIILHIRSSLNTTHVVVLRGMSFDWGEPLLYINDPIYYFTQPIPFSQLMGIWVDAIVVG